MKAFTLVSAASLLAAAAAVPDVIPRQLGTTADCRYWPSWINTRDVDITGTLMFTVDSADDEAINGLLLNQFDVQFASKALPLLGVDLRSSGYFARNPVRCRDGIARLGIQAQDQLRISRDKNNANILINPSANKTTLVPELYRHTIDGQEQEGVYLGWGNQTTWGFRYQDAVCGANGVSTREFVEVKLLGLPASEDDSAGYESWFKGFVKVVVW